MGFRSLFRRGSFTVKSRAATDHRQMFDAIQPDGTATFAGAAVRVGGLLPKCGCVYCETARRNLP